MFGNDKNPSATSRRASSGVVKDGGVTILTAGCHFAGKLYCKGATRIGGTIDGEIIAEGLLIVEEDAVINAQVKAEEVVVHGRVEGNMLVHKKIEMCATADVQADVSTPNLIVQEGAMYNGRTVMKRTAASGQEGKGRDGKVVRDLNPTQPPSTSSGTDTNQSNNIAARMPDISFA
jgi:cytoskeletal protein CcmA (bactofilin family)